MKRALTLLSFLILSTSLLWGQFIEEYRSPINRKPPNSLTAQIDGFQSPRDINGNGSEDVNIILEDSLFVRDGKTFEVILSWKVEEGEKGFELTEFTLRAPGDPNKDISVTHAVGFYDKSTPGIKIYDVDNGNIVYSNDDLVFIGIADFDNGGMAEILAFDVVNRQTVILGVKDADFKQNTPEEEPLIASSGNAYQLELKFEGRPQRRMVPGLDLDEARRKYDVNQDGRAEVVMFKISDQNEEIGIEVVNPNNGNVVWSYDYPTEYAERMRSKFHGFIDANGDDTAELFFGRNLVVTLDEEVYEIANGFNLAGFFDFNDDGYMEVIGYNSTEEKVQVWGAPMSTSIFDDLVDVQGFDPDVFPNPSVGHPYYRFDLHQSADVQLDISNAHGQAIGRVLSGWLKRGNHQGRIALPNWPGLYFATWRINGQVVHTHHIIKK